MGTDLAANIIATLRDHEVALRGAGIQRLSLFGSVARGDATTASDIDLAVLLDPDARIGFALIGLERHLSAILGRTVYLIPEPRRKTAASKSYRPGSPHCVLSTMPSTAFAASSRTWTGFRPISTA